MNCPTTTARTYQMIAHSVSLSAHVYDMGVYDVGRDAIKHLCRFRRRPHLLLREERISFGSKAASMSYLMRPGPFKAYQRLCSPSVPYVTLYGSLLACSHATATRCAPCPATLNRSYSSAPSKTNLSSMACPLSRTAVAASWLSTDLSRAASMPVAFPDAMIAAT